MKEWCTRGYLVAYFVKLEFPSVSLHLFVEWNIKQMCIGPTKCRAMNKSPFLHSSQEGSPRGSSMQSWMVTNAEMEKNQDDDRRWIWRRSPLVSVVMKALLEEVTSEQSPQWEELKEKHLRQRGHRYQSLEMGQGSVSVGTGKGLLWQELVARGARGPGGMQLEEEEVRPCRCL